MAKLINIDDGQTEVPDNTPLLEPLDEMGVAFGCSNGLCHSCRIEITEGTENLTELTQQEKDGGLERSPDRLACQCSIKSGTVKFRY